ncbi:PfkB family carbohydrate kinase [Dongshaea marina]|uniref:PfkB family carbohydrate kinase n=1 Tax=Dongshaea marina TaxID=2047966 RepID=UPI000D3E31C0|nr:PfkB family carbohydrate kinase [Dongshaea marina]
MTQREQQLLALLRDDPMISQQQLAQNLGISRSAVASHIMNLTRKGLILGKGYVLSEPTYAVVVGGANIDICGRGMQQLDLGESNPGGVTISAGGVARNVAENLARLGQQVRLISAVGCDPHGDRLLQDTRASGVDTSLVLQLPDQATSVYLSLLNPDGELHTAVNDMAIVEQLSAELVYSHRSLLSHASLIIADCNLPQETLEAITDSAPGVPLFVDTVSRCKASKIQPLLSKIHTLKPNRAEAEYLSGIAFNTPKDLKRIGDWFHQQGVQRLCLSLGEQGCYLSSQGCEPLQLKAHSVELCNANGAGDALLGALAHAHLEGWEDERALRFGLAAAELTLSDPQTIHPRLSQTTIEQRLEAFAC